LQENWEASRSLSVRDPGDDIVDDVVLRAPALRHFPNNWPQSGNLHPTWLCSKNYQWCPSLLAENRHAMVGDSPLNSLGIEIAIGMIISVKFFGIESPRPPQPCPIRSTRQRQQRPFEKWTRVPLRHENNRQYCT